MLDSMFDWLAPMSYLSWILLLFPTHSEFDKKTFCFNCIFFLYKIIVFVNKYHT